MEKPHEKLTIVAERVCNMPVPAVPSVVEVCSSCGEVVWVGEHLREQLPDSAVVCTACVPKDASLSVHPATEDELAEIGFDPEDVEALLEGARTWLRRERH